MNSHIRIEKIILISIDSCVSYLIWNRCTSFCEKTVNYGKNRCNWNQPMTLEWNKHMYVFDGSLEFTPVLCRLFSISYSRGIVDIKEERFAKSGSLWAFEVSQNIEDLMDRENDKWWGTETKKDKTGHQQTKAPLSRTDWESRQIRNTTANKAKKANFKTISK